MEVRPGYKLTEVGVIPDDWEAASFASLGSVIDGDRGVNYPGSRDFIGDGHCLFLNAGNVTKAGFRFGECAFISHDKDEELSKGKLRRDDIVLTTRGTVGNFAHFDTTVPFGHIRINSGMVILRKDSPALDTKFLYALLQSHLVAQQIERLTFGSAQPQLTVKGICEFVIVVPPISEQRAIAAALSDVGTLLAGLERLIAKKRDLKQAAMQQLLTGQVRLPGFRGAWEEKRLGEVATFHKGRGLPKSAISASGAEPCIHYGELFTRYPETITEIISRTDMSDGTFRSIVNDVLMPTSDVTPRGLAKASCVRTDGVIVGGDILVIRSDPKLVFGSFLSYLIRHNEEQVLQRVTGSTVFHLYGSDMMAFSLSMPPLTEQTAIAAILSDMDTELSLLTARRDKTRALKQAMMQELLTGRTRLV